MIKIKFVSTALTSLLALFQPVSNLEQTKVLHAIRNAKIERVQKLQRIPTLDQWLDASKDLPCNQAIKISKGKSIFASFSDNICDQKQFFKFLIQKHNEIRKQQLQNPKIWQQSNMNQLYPHDFNDGFHPFVQCINATQDQRFILRGDLHGDIFSLLAQLENMREKNLIDNNFKLKENVHVITLGDLADRGNYGAEVYATLAILFIQNPEQVHLIRGNHEDIFMTTNYGFAEELKLKFEDIDGSLHTWMSQMHSLMPVAIYLGNAKNEYLQLCHGGIEQGYHPKDLLESNKSYQLIGKLQRNSAIEKTVLDSNISEQSKIDFQRILPHMKDNLILTAPTSDDLPLGFMWNDFDPQSTQHAVRINPERGLEYGQEGTNIALSQQETPLYKIIGIIRAHQHSCDPNDCMMKNILRNSGMWNMNPLDKRQNWMHRTIGLYAENKDVYTINVAPDTVYGEMLDFKKDTTIILQPDKWKMNVQEIIPDCFKNKLYQAIYGTYKNHGSYNDFRF